MILGYYVREDGTQYIHYGTIDTEEIGIGEEYLVNGESWCAGDDVERLLPQLKLVGHLPDRENMMKSLKVSYPHAAITNYMEQMVGEIAFERSQGIGEIIQYTDEQKYLKAVADEIEYSASTGFSYKTFSSNPDVRKGIDDIIYDLYGEDNPNDIDYYRKKYNPEKALVSEEEKNNGKKLEIS